MKLIDWVLARYPSEFRGRFGEDMRAALARTTGARARGGGSRRPLSRDDGPAVLWFGLVERLPRPATIYAFLTVNA